VAASETFPVEVFTKGTDGGPLILAVVFGACGIGFDVKIQCRGFSTSDSDIFKSNSAFLIVVDSNFELAWRDPLDLIVTLMIGFYSRLWEGRSCPIYYKYIYSS
jgi:hypothetical protein